MERTVAEWRVTQRWQLRNLSMMSHISSNKYLNPHGVLSHAVNGAWYSLSSTINLHMIRTRAEKRSFWVNTTLCFQLGSTWGDVGGRFPRGCAPTITTSLENKQEWSELSSLQRINSENMEDRDDCRRCIPVVVLAVQNVRQNVFTTFTIVNVLSVLSQ